MIVPIPFACYHLEATHHCKEYPVAFNTWHMPRRATSVDVGRILLIDSHFGSRAQKADLRARVSPHFSSNICAELFRSRE